MSVLLWDEGPKRSTRQKVCLATCVYDSPDASYTFAIQKSRQALEGAGIQSAYLLLSGNCHVDDARNHIVQEFLLSDCTDLIFLDADVSWEPEQLVRLCGFDKDLVGGVYPFRRVETKQLGNMPVRLTESDGEPDADGLLEVDGLPTGFMRIRRVVLETLAKTVPSYFKSTDRRAPIPLLFERIYEPGPTPETGTRWGGDLEFCNRWRRAGGKIYAVVDMRLGHVAKSIVYDSLGSALRRQKGTTLQWAADRLRRGTFEAEDFGEVFEAVGNKWAAAPDVLLACAMMAQRARGPIIEAGSGLSTVLMAAANPDQIVYCLEHDPLYAEQLRRMAQQAGVTNIGLVNAPIKDGWYDQDAFDGLPAKFAVGVCDGPPRKFRSRMRFFDVFGDRVSTIVVDDMDERDYAKKVLDWCVANNRDIQNDTARLAIISRLKQAS